VESYPQLKDSVVSAGHPSQTGASNEIADISTEAQQTGQAQIYPSSEAERGRIPPVTCHHGARQDDR
jgi:hypothetical protein